jgi:hypothetical protein
MSLKDTVDAWSVDAWLNIIVASLLNYLSFINAMKTFELILVCSRDSLGVLGSTPLRMWSAREWWAIRARSFGISIALTVAHLASRAAEPYLLLYGCFVYLAAKIVATGLSSRAPRGKWQLLSMKTAEVLTEFPPFQHLPGRYKAPASLFVAALLLIWVLYVGLEQAFSYFVVSENNFEYPLDD